ncbi:MAG TPA: helix-hairpin-helix domain-containing protein [Candidatus Acidoferrum sp.]|nr:helix-hairpin-helix domain-containing protein [Candidatus Acidoferrum sp.]
MLRRAASFRVLFFLGLITFLFSAGSFAKKKPPEKPVNINTASSEQLQTVPGIGPVTAEKILKMRKSYGAFKSVDDLLAIRGLGPKRLDKMRKYLTVGKAVAPKAAQPAASPAASPQKQSDKP